MRRVLHRGVGCSWVSDHRFARRNREGGLGGADPRGARQSCCPDELHKWDDGIEVHETSNEGEGLVAVLARWNGVEGGFYVRFGQWREDML